MENNRRALYHSLRMNWMLNPKLNVEMWQIADYRAKPLNVLFEQLIHHDIHLDKQSFLIFAENMDDPESLTDALISDNPPGRAAQDHIYLLIFELWRRLLPERPCLSILCDEIDYQINLYDRGEMQKEEAIQDSLANLQMLLDENNDAGIEPLEVFEYVNAACANDLESFLLDYISDQIDNGNYPYASELIEGFSQYIYHVKWFKLLQARILSLTDPQEAIRMVLDLLKNQEPDLEFLLEVLSFLIPNGDEATFKRLVKQAIALSQNEDDFQTIITICIEFYNRLDEDELAKTLQALLNQRGQFDLNKKIDTREAQFIEFLKVMSIPF